MGGQSAFEARPGERPINVGAGERVVSLTAGSVLALFGLSRRSLPGVLVATLGGGLVYRGLTGYCRMYQALGVDRTRREAQPEDYFQRGIHVEESYYIRRRPAELYQYWRNFENLPRLMKHLESVRVIDDKRSHWVAKAPGIAGGQVEWDAEIINEEPNALIAWRSVPGADVDNAGSIRFLPGAADRGTKVDVVLDYIPPAGAVGKWVARLFGEEPQQQIKEDLRNFKRVMETGEVPTIQGQPQGTCKGGGVRHEGW